jgi:hypothetical protein
MSETEESPRALYLYCVGRKGALAEFEEPGIDATSPISLYAVRELAAVVTAVDPREFQGPEAEARLADLAWVGPRAIHHERVVEKAMTASPVLPARFGTLFSNPERLERVLLSHRASVLEFLERVEGKEEWAVKGYLDRSAAIQGLVARRSGSLEAALASKPGTRYFQELKLRREAEQEVERAVQEALGQVREALRRSWGEFRERALYRDPGAEGELVCNWSFLVPKVEAGNFAAAVETQNRERAGSGLRLKAAGPLPAYSFTPRLGEG